MLQGSYGGKTLKMATRIEYDHHGIEDYSGNIGSKND